MKRMVIVIVLLIAAWSVSADPALPVTDAALILDLAPGLDGQLLSEVSVNELLAAAEVLSIHRQQEMYIFRAAAVSMVIPGLGQLTTGEPGRGLGHLGIGLGVVGATLFGLNQTLPDDLKPIIWDGPARTAYLESATFGEIWPSATVLVGGAGLYFLNAWISARGATRSAEQFIQSGRVQFEPNFAYLGDAFEFGVSVRL